jgi:hypothetical protein
MDFISGIYYWTSEATAEVDFVFADSRNMYPVEVKAGENLRSRSLKVYRERYAPNLAIRTSLSNLRLDDGLLNIPLFALFNLENYLRSCDHMVLKQREPTASQRTLHTATKILEHIP